MRDVPWFHRLRSLFCTGLSGILLQMSSVKEYLFQAAIFTCCCKLKEWRMFLFCFLNSSGLPAKSIFVSHARKITPFHFAVTSESNYSKPSNDESLSDTIELFWHVAGLLLCDKLCLCVSINKTSQVLSFYIKSLHTS